MPLNYQTPVLMKAIRAQLGAELAVYTVGSPHNQINPGSGLPAFAGEDVSFKMRKDKCLQIRQEIAEKKEWVQDLLEAYEETKSLHHLRSIENFQQKIKELERTAETLNCDKYLSENMMKNAI